MLDGKLERAESLIVQWHDFHKGNISVSFSGGKDSTALLHIVRSLYPGVPAVFADTGLEFPEVRAFVRTIENVQWVRPEMKFREVIRKYGYPVVSKKVAKMVRVIRDKPGTATANLYETGYNQAGQFSRNWQLPRKWRILVDAPFRISEQCCDALKREPLHRVYMETREAPMTAIMAADSRARGRTAKNGCNIYSRTRPVSRPMFDWTTDDVWEYIRRNGVPYSQIYDMGEHNTGCMFCAFGAHLEPDPNRFQRMERTHPAAHRYCMDKLGLADVLKFIGVRGGE